MGYNSNIQRDDWECDEMFTNENLKRLILPLVVEQILAVTIGMSDTIMVSSVGEAAVSGLSLVDTINILLINIFAALATGGAVVCSQYLGGRDRDRACVSAKQLIVSTGIFAVIIMGIVLIGCTAILQLVFTDVEPAVMWNAEIYFKISAWSYPFIALYNSGAALFRSMGNSRISMVISIVMNTINVVGNAVCIFGLHMGVAGVAYPTLAGRMVAAVLMVYLIQKPDNIIRINRLSELRPNFHMIRNILSIGIPNGLESGMFQFGKIALQSLVSSLGTAAIASYAVASNLVTLLYLPGNAIGLGLITIVGQCVGAGETGQAKQYTRQLTGINYAILIVLCTVMIVFGGPLVGIYRLSSEASAISRQMITAHSIAMVVWPLAFTIPYTLRASLDAKFTMAVSVFSMWVFRIAFAYLFVRIFHLGVMGVWYGMFIDWIFRAAVFSLRFHGLEKRAVSVS